MVPRNERPEPDDLKGYAAEYPSDPSYDDVLMERAQWISDYHRRAEENRDLKREGREPLYGHDGLDREERSSGYDPNMDMEALTAIVLSQKRAS